MGSLPAIHDSDLRSLRPLLALVGVDVLDGMPLEPSKISFWAPEVHPQSLLKPGENGNATSILLPLASAKKLISNALGRRTKRRDSNDSK